LGIGDWGLGIGDWAQSPIPNPQSPIPNPHYKLFKILKTRMNLKNNNLNNIYYIHILFDYFIKKHFFHSCHY